MRWQFLLLAPFLTAFGCSTPSTSSPGTDLSADAVFDLAGDLQTDWHTTPTDLHIRKDLSTTEFPLEILSPETAEPGCAPGDGCFLDPCTENQDCLSGWCVGHMGENVCTQQCESECPPGWSCQQIPGTAPDIVFICVSDHANLCLPCSSGTECKGAAGNDGACLDYGDEGSFCGGICATNEDCPWGFSCLTTVTVDGIDIMQCVADAGVCPCTGKSVALGLWTPCVVTSEAGLCTGKRVCTDSGLSDCDATLPSEDLCDGIDNNCDGDVDEETCNDDNECTDDICLGEEGCNHTPVAIGECKDGDPCTVADHCEEGLCVGDAVECNDDNPCTEDSCTATGGCEFDPKFGPCDDGDPCTAGDLCTDGECGGSPVDCDCLDDSDCEPLEDGDLCNGSLVCDTGTLPYRCSVDPETTVECPAPEGPDSSCLVALCAADTGACLTEMANEGSPCSDGDFCTMNDTCDSGICTGGTLVNCNDANPCTDDSCDSDNGCEYLDNQSLCSDENVCTVGDLCQEGLCVGGAPLTCDDGNLCTLDSCDGDIGCTYAAAPGGCDDGNACTVNDQCDEGVCAPGDPVVCDDDNSCTTDACDPVQGCIHLLNSAPCDDGDICTTGDHCHLGSCTGGGTLVCNDNNLCTDDSCGAESGCTFIPNADECNDDNPCTENDACSNGWCAGIATVCNDFNVCTDDSCNPDSGCEYTANTQPCNDNNPCTIGDHCNNSSCEGEGMDDCDDGNICTDDECDPDSGCFHAANSAQCNDGNACTTGEVCANKTCTPGVAVVCNDNDICTDDSCEPDSGCLFAHNTASCNDSDACTEDDECSGGDCAGDSVDCDDLEPCTTDGCDIDSGCTHVAVANETNCGANHWYQGGVCTEKAPQTVVIDTLNYNGMTGWPLKFDGTPYCQPTTDQQQMDALCQLAGYSKAIDWVYETKSINICYCWGSCSNFAWHSNCCSGQQTQIMVTQVTCSK
jgi:hypothetical protein